MAKDQRSRSDRLLNGADLRLTEIATAAPLAGQIDHCRSISTLAQDMSLRPQPHPTPYCVAAGTEQQRLLGTDPANQQDLKWKNLYSNNLTLTIDNDLPTANFTALPNGALLGMGQVIGGSASDPTSGVALVEVSINNGPWQAATGSNSWAFSLAGVSGAITLRVRASDKVGNVGNPSAAINLSSTTLRRHSRSIQLPIPQTNQECQRTLAGQPLWHSQRCQWH